MLKLGKEKNYQNGLQTGKLEKGQNLILNGQDLLNVVNIAILSKMLKLIDWSKWTKWSMIKWTIFKSRPGLVCQNWQENGLITFLQFEIVSLFWCEKKCGV